jgi:hypothetical protein
MKNVRLALIWENKCCTQEMTMESTIATVTLTVILKLLSTSNIQRRLDCSWELHA